MSTKKLGLICLLAFMVSAGMRFLEARRWDPEIHKLDGEYLLATHDAYAWVAGADREDARTHDLPMSRMLAAFEAITSLSPANLAYWLPAILAGLSAIPIALWALHLGASPVCAWASGVFGSLAPAFFARTRVGYYDTDWATFFFPLLISWGLAVWLQPYLRSDTAGVAPNGGWLIRQPYLLLAVMPIGIVWHEFIRTYTLLILWLAVMLAAWMGKRSSRSEMVLVLLATTLATGMGWVGVAAGSILIFLRNYLAGNWLNKDSRARGAAILLLLLLVLFTGIQFREYLLGKLAQYAGLSAGGATSVPYPDLGASVREVQSVGVLAALEGASYQWWLGLLGLLGIALLLGRNPGAAFLMPLLLLGVLSPGLGARFTMYASPVLLLGVLVPPDGRMAKLLESRGHWGLRAKALSLGALVSLMLLVQRDYARLPIETVLDREHADALRKLKSIADSEGLAWTWWDYGYATQYFTGLPTFADGGRNTGPHLFTLGRVLGSRDLRASGNLMAYSARHDDAPWLSWESLDSSELAARVQELESAGNMTDSAVPQYLVVQWEAISFLPWIQYYGYWDFHTADGQWSQVEYFLHPLKLDLEQGRFTERQGRTYDLASADLLDRAGSSHYEFPDHQDARHLLIHMDSSEVYLLDTRSYNSTLVQLLIMPSVSFSAAGPFEAVVDASPDARVFRLR